METKTFKRSRGATWCCHGVMVGVSIMAWVCAVLVIPYFFWLAFAIMILLPIALMVIEDKFFPKFEYGIVVTDAYITLRAGKNCRISFNKKSLDYDVIGNSTIVLNDGLHKFPIRYNRELRKFLEENVK